MLQLTFSNRFEILLDGLIGALAAEDGDVFAPRHVIVPSVAVRRRVELALADRTGVCANVAFSYLGQWLWARIGQVLAVPADSPFDPAALGWRIYEALGDSAFTGGHPRLAAYLAAADPVMRLDLAQRIARVIEETITYRPQWLAAWAEGRTAGIAGLEADAAEDEAWQAALWRRIAAELGTGREHPSVAFFRAIENFGPDALARAGLPQAAHFFCLPALPPLYLNILRQLGRWMHLRLHLLNPCREYWFDVVDAKRLTLLAARGRQDYHETGNAILAGWGRQTQAQIELLLEHDDIDERGSAFRSNDGTTLLARLQDAILDLAEPEPGRMALAGDDESIEVHVCHSLTRELEVLHDRLLALFTGPQPPHPGDILVVTPDLDAAAPLIDAVFGNAAPGRRIPYRITGLAPLRVNPVARVLDALLGLGASRHAASAVFDLLQLAPVARRFDLGAAELEAIRGWVRDAGIRWGLDEGERRGLGLPADERHTFRDGIERLYLAYAVGRNDAVIAGRVGAADPEGQEAAALGRLWRYVETLRALERRWRRPLSPQAWREALEDALEALVAPDAEWIDDRRAVRESIAAMARNMARGGLRSALPLEVVRSALTEALEDAAHGAVPGGAVSFAPMGGMRGLPFRVVCAIGLDDGAFPTGGRPVEFDLMALRPQRGDRQRALDERNLFLDLLLAARERLYLSYAGRSIRDNSPQPPSVLVDELLDWLLRACAADDAASDAVRRRLVVEHPLQPFSRECFLDVAAADPRLRSFHAEYCDALREALRAKPAAAAVPFQDETAGEDEETAALQALTFFAVPLPEPEAALREVSIDQLTRFFANPCRHLLRERLGIALPEGEEELLDDEPFLPDWPGRQALAQRLLPAALAGGGEGELLDLARAGTEYPAGRVGEAALGAEVARLRRFADALAQDLAAPLEAVRSARLDIRLDGEAWSLAGSIGDRHGGQIVRWRYDEARPRDYLSAWIAHLFARASHPAATALQTRWHARDGVFRLAPCPQAAMHLESLMALYRRGLGAPLPFFPRSAWEFVASGGNLAKARNRWISSRERPWGENSDRAYRLALRGVADPLAGDFAAIAQAVFGPLREHLEDAPR